VAGQALAETAQLLADVQSGAIEGVLALGFAAAESAAQLAPLSKLRASVTLAANVGPLTEVATVLVPIAGHAETSGTFVNAKGKAQQFKRAVFAPDGIRSGWETIADLAKKLGAELGFGSLKEVRAQLPAVQEAQA
jgi:NADH-quinone oxidoreductase subunit G